MTIIEFDDEAGLKAALTTLLATIPEKPGAHAARPAEAPIDEDSRQGIGPGGHMLWAAQLPTEALPLVPFAVAMLGRNAYVGRRRTGAANLGHAIGVPFEGNPRHATAVVERALAVTRARLAWLADNLGSTPPGLCYGVPDDPADERIAVRQRLEAEDAKVPAPHKDDYGVTARHLGLGFRYHYDRRTVSHGYGSHPAKLMVEPVDGPGQRFVLHDPNEGGIGFLALFGIEKHGDPRGQRHLEMPANGSRLDAARRAAVVSWVLNAYVCGQGALTEAEKAAPYGGDMTWFDEVGNDGRDALLAHLAAGGSAVLRSLIDDELRLDDPEGLYVELEGTGRVVDGSAAGRLVNAGLARIEQAWARHDMGPPPPPWPRRIMLAEGVRPNRHQLRPRATAVTFDAFQNACSYRRYPDSSEGRECTHKKAGGYNGYCESDTCPLTTQAYRNETDRWGRNEDPYFESEGRQEGMVLVQADTPNVRGSRAWQLAGVARIEAIVNRCAAAVYQTGGKTSRYLTKGAEEAAGHEAVAAGHLVVDEVLKGFGTVFRLNDALAAQMDERYRQAVAAQAARQAASANQPS